MTTRLIYYPFAYYYRPFASSIWIDISSAIKTQAKWELLFTGNNLLSFNFQMNEINDSDGVLIVPRTGDDFCICENSKAIRIVDDQLCGKAWPAKPNRDGSWHTAQNRPRLFWDINVMQRDFSTIATVTLEYKTPTLLSEMVTALLLLTTGDKLGGVMADGTVIEKWKLIAPDIYVESFDYSGYPMGGLINLLSSIGYKFLIKYYVEPHITNNIKVFAQVEIIEGIGTIPRSPLWINGISNDVFRRATVLNPDYDGTYNPDEPQYLPMVTDFDIDPDPSTIRNSLGILAYVQDGDSLTEYIEVQGDKPKDTFDLGYRYRDIIFASRFIQCKVSKDSVPDATHFSVPKAEADKMVYDQTNRLIAGDYLVCKITHLTIPYYYNFTISGQLITLISLAYGSTAIPSAMVVGEDFQLVKSVSILEDNRQFGAGYPNYGAVKNTTLTSNGTLRFLKYDIPRPADKVYIAGYKLEEYKTNINDINSINNFDPLPDTLEIDFPVTKEQVGIIETVLAEQAKELTTVSFTSTLPDPPYPGDKFPVEITNLYDDTVVVNTVKSSFISVTGEKGKPKIKREVSCAPRRSSYVDVISKFKQSYKLKNPTTPENIKDKIGSEISLIWEISDFARPENLIASGITETEFTVTWDAVTDAVRYGIEIATNVNFTNSSILTGYHGYAQTSNIITVNSPFLIPDTLYYFRAFAINATGKESAWSDTLQVTSTTIVPRNGLIGEWLFTTDFSDTSGNGYDGTAAGAAAITGGKLVLGNNANDAVSLPYTPFNGLANLSITGTAKINTTHTTNYLISFARTGNDNVGGILFRNGAGQFNIYREADEALFSDTTIKTTECNFAFTISGPDAKLYINGSLISTQTLNSTALNITSGGVIVGQEQDSVGGGFDVNQAWSGTIKNLRLYDRVLSPEEVIIIDNLS